MDGQRRIAHEPTLQVQVQRGKAHSKVSDEVYSGDQKSKRKVRYWGRDSAVLSQE